MAEPFVGEIRQVGFNFAPPGWVPCNGQTIPISGYETLFALIGTTYGGDGQTTFGVPDLQGRVTVHQGQGTGPSYSIGQKSGSESVTITQNQMAAHSHVVQANSQLATISAVTAKSTWAEVTPDGSAVNAAYASPPGNVTLSPSIVSAAGGSLPIDIRQPYLVVNFMIATVGIYPSQS